LCGDERDFSGREVANRNLSATTRKSTAAKIKERRFGRRSDFFEEPV
jgi:hypothetical protein